MIKTQSYSDLLPNAFVKYISVYKHDNCGICFILLSVSSFKSPLTAKKKNSSRYYNSDCDIFVLIFAKQRFQIEYLLEKKNKKAKQKTKLDNFIIVS